MKITPIYQNKIICLPAEAVTERLTSATADELKVLISLIAEPEFDLPSRAAELDLTEKSVLRAIDSWTAAGVLKTEDPKTAQAGETESVEAAPPEQLTLDGTAEKSKKKRVLSRSALPHYSSEELADAVEKTDGAGELIDACQQLLGRIFNTAETAVIVGMLDYLGLKPDYILLLCSHAAAMEKTSVRYVEKMAIDLHDRGIDTYETLEEELKRVEVRSAMETWVRELFGIGRRAFIKKEKGFIDAWANTYRFGKDMVAKAYEVTVSNTQGASMDYTNRVLENWYASGYTTPEEVDAAKAERKEQKSAPEGTSFSTDDFWESALKRSYKPGDGEDGNG